MEGNKRGQVPRPVSVRDRSTDASKEGPKRSSQAAPIVGRKITDPKVSWNLGALTARVTQPVSQPDHTSQAAGNGAPVLEPRGKGPSQSAEHWGAVETSESRLPEVGLELGAGENPVAVAGDGEALYQQRLQELRQKALDIMNGSRASYALSAGASRRASEERNDIRWSKLTRGTYNANF